MNHGGVDRVLVSAEGCLLPVVGNQLLLADERGVYGDCVQEMDWSVGEVLKTLDELKLSENTLVIFCSDNGPQIQYREDVTGGAFHCT